MTAGLDDIARDFVALFEKKGFPYAVMGGLAVRLYALPRPTFDVDFTVSIPREAMTGLYQEAETLGYTISDAQAGGWIDSVREMPVIKFQWYIGSRAIDIDVFLAETPFQSELLKRRVRHAGEGWEGWFVTAEDLILLKLLANRPKDRVDVADVLFVQGELDVEYLRHWADELGVGEALDEALSQANE